MKELAPSCAEGVRSAAAVQRRRIPAWETFWKRYGKQLERIAAGLEQAWAPGAAWEWEHGLLSRIFRLRRPNIWQRLQYSLDRHGGYQSET